MNAEAKFLKVSQVAPLLGLSVFQVYRLVAAGHLPAIRQGRAVRIPRGALETWLAECNRMALASVSTSSGAASGAVES